MTGFLAEHHLPGASLAVARDGRLVYARGFGLADPESGELVRPDSLFRIASLSKPITAVAVFRLIEQGKLKLDDRLVDWIDAQHQGRPLHPGDARLKQVTIRQLLQHRGGWDRSVSFDPMFRSVRFARELGLEPPAGPWQVITAMWTRPLDFDPGAHYRYSNYGYCLLGRIIERASGLPYETFVRREILEPLSIESIRMGKTLLTDRAPREVHYKVGETVKSKVGRAVVGPDQGRMVPLPYGAWYLEAMDSHGAWIASPTDLVRFASAFDPARYGALLNESSIKEMFARPDAGPDEASQPSYYACGWNVRDRQPRGRLTTWHTGYLDGATSIMVRRHDGLTWAVTFNSDVASNGKSASSLIDPLLHKAANAVEEWPMKDLFEGRSDNDQK